ncbi:MAG TPA: selenocysteine-specific translation elongation factor [Pseudonocardiaceae bacterium]|nr:selenocysteine-specific translation elongation factor [Pseudonocardiaceae bacterium]
MHVIATAGHVDHGKSTLVHALTGMEPDRWAEERRRGMTLDLGFVWTTLGSGETVAFVDVPGHERFVTTMLAGVGPVPAVLVVVAADEGWRAQTAEHVSMLNSLGVRHGLLVVTRADLADPEPTLADARARLARTSLAGCVSVAVSAVTGTGMPALRAALDQLVAELPPAATTGRVRLFVDRAFTIKGSGTVVTGTLAAGTLSQGDQLELAGTGTRIRVRGLQALGKPADTVPAVARVAVNLRGLPVDEIARGDALVTPDTWVLTDEADIRMLDIGATDLPGDLVLHIGSAAVPCRVRPLGEDTARLRMATRLPLQPGDRAVLREPSSRLATGVVVVDVDPPVLLRRGAAKVRAAELEDASDGPDVLAEVARRGSVTRARLAALGILDTSAALPDGLLTFGEHIVHPASWQRWRTELADAVDQHRAATPLEPGLPAKAAQQLLGLSDARLVDALVRDSGGALIGTGGRIARPGSGPSFTEAVQRALDEVRKRLDADPLDAPDVPELAEAGLTTAILAAAAKAGLVLRLPGDVILHPSAPDAATAVIATLEQPFTLSEARKALGTTRRIAVPLLEHLDTIGNTVRVDASRRRVTGHAS